MDNLTHTLCGLALARCGLDRTDRLATATLVIASNLPDIDVVWSSGPAYLIYHRGITHAVVGIVAQIALLTAAMVGVGRLLPGPDSRPRAIALAAGVGLAAHPLLDLLNTYGIRPWLPFDPTWYYGDVAFIVDPWLWLVLGAAACLGAPRTRIGLAGWAALALATTLLVGSQAGQRVPQAALWVWLAGLALIAGSRAMGVGTDGPRVSRSMVGLALVYLLLLGIASHTAKRRALGYLQTHHPGLDVVSSSAHPQAAVPWGWDVLAETPETIHRVRLDLKAGATEERLAIARNLDDPALDKVRDTLGYRAWRVFARHAFCCRRDGGLLLGDARYSQRPGPGWANVLVPIPRD